MKLLIVTQSVDKKDPVLGFFHRWIEEFSSRVESVEVICLREGEYAFASNVRVHSLGKEKGGTAFSRIRYAIRFLSLVGRLRKDYDTVFVHMNPIYLLLAGWFWRLSGVRTALWYTHKHVDWKLRFAEKVAGVVFTASVESFRLKSSKVVVTGHGIDTDHFSPATSRTDSSSLRLLTVGRISAVKNTDRLLEALRLLIQQGVPSTLTIVGAPSTKVDEEYLARLRSWVSEHELGDVVRWVGAVSHDSLPPYFHNHDIFVSLSDTGSFDKAVAEALASGLPVVTSNLAFSQVPDVSCIESSDAKMLASRVALLSSQVREGAGRAYIIERHSLSRLIPLLLSNLERPLNV